MFKCAAAQEHANTTIIHFPRNQEYVVCVNAILSHAQGDRVIFLSNDYLTTPSWFKVFDLPPVTMEITEHRIHQQRCTCGKIHRSEFPVDVVAPVQYGPGVKALAVYLTQHHMLPVARTARLLSDLYGVPISAGTIQAMIAEAGSGWV